MKKYKPLSFKKAKRYSLDERTSKVTIDLISKPHKKGNTLKNFIEELPNVLAVKDFKDVVKAVVLARNNSRPVVLGMGAHPIKVGLSPIIIDLLNRGIITAIATNGACIIHDFEFSYAGHTSEDVEKGLQEGTFGMADETGKYLNRAINEGLKEGYGVGKSVGKMIYKSRFRFKDKSIFGNAYKLSIPATVHVAIGTDIIHVHPETRGACLGEASFIDFKLFTSVISDLDGGVYINLGSAVIMPEVFLKAITIVRNLGFNVDNITTVNMDFIQHYRPVLNVLKRPTKKRGFSYALTGHHEIMFPLLAAAIIEELG